MAHEQLVTGVFLVHTLKCGIGGMESHQRAFIKHYFYNQDNNTNIDFRFLIENEENFVVHEYQKGVLVSTQMLTSIEHLLLYLKERINGKMVVFLNDGWWIEYVTIMRNEFANASILFRTGGNDIELAPWNEGQFDYSQRRLLWLNSLNNLNCIIANSEYSVLLLRNMKVKESLIRKIRGGVDANVCKHLRTNKHLLRQRLKQNLNISQKYLLTYACRFVSFKGIIQGLKAIKNSKIFQNCHILLVGSGTQQKEILEWCKNNMSDEQYTFLGELPNCEVLQVIAASDILLNTSLFLRSKSGDGIYYHTETMGRTMMEAINLGTKVLATNVGGTAELFEECVGIGKLVHPNIRSITNGIDDLISNLDEPIKKTQDYSWHAVFNEYDKLFKI